MRYRATFTPQAWVNDYTIIVDSEGPIEWDCTDYILSLSVSERLKALEPDTYDSDGARLSDNCPEWVRNWGGPFYITVEIQEYL